MVRKNGRPTFFTSSEEREIVSAACLLAKRGDCLDKPGIKTMALAMAVLNHKDQPITKKWCLEGVSRQWFKGFMKQHKTLLSIRYGEGLCSNRRQVTQKACESVRDTAI